jgi:lipid-binding SYLF domain-containing protein
MKKQRLLAGCLVLALLQGAAAAQAGLFGPSGDSVEEKQAAVRREREKTLAELVATKPELQERIRRAAGYATFTQKDVNLFLLASGQGYGVLVDNASGAEVFMRVASLGGGVGMGVRDLRVVFIFHDRKVMEQFVQSGWQFGGKADAAAKYKDAGAAAEQKVQADIDFREGTIATGASTDARAGTQRDDKAGVSLAAGGPIEVYQFTESGVSLQATVAGTKYWKDSKLNR